MPAAPQPYGPAPYGGTPYPYGPDPYAAYGPYPPGYMGPYGYPPPMQYVPAPAAPATIPYQEGAATPPGYRLEERTRKGLVVGGAVLAGVGYFFMLLAAPLVDAAYEDKSASVMLVPVVGPFIAIPVLDSEGIGTSALIMDGLMQAGGTAMLIGGLAAKKKVWVRIAGGPELQIRPALVGGGTPGIGIESRF